MPLKPFRTNHNINGDMAILVSQHLLTIKETVNNEIKSKGLVSDCSCNDIEYMSIEYFVGRRLEVGILMAFEADAENMS